MTSDHRVAGSSPAGCKSSLRADRLSILAAYKSTISSPLVFDLRQKLGFPLEPGTYYVDVKVFSRDELTSVRKHFRIGAETEQAAKDKDWSGTAFRDVPVRRLGEAVIIVLSSFICSRF